MAYEYSVIPAPNRGHKARDAKTPTDRYALAITAELNRMAADGWEYLRADVLPSEERSGLTGRATVYHNLLVFRRPTRAANQQAAKPASQAQPEDPVAAAPGRPDHADPPNATQPEIPPQSGEPVADAVPPAARTTQAEK
ncbi:DUF4177 domain-containing protein [Paracoccus salsus]|uniref:DUF4177 domain-containing protein n=1 Tax=Paracoccus salsus TaxID=2911061 RepID=UPI001F25F8C4|nr:DUF4177 domain-containing protein [Paracoccus salsus]MCF3974019.1 DUF4177 domain-containing protein [Paracoccus salsus]